VRFRQASAANIPAMMVLERQSSAAGHWSKRQYEDLFRNANSPRLSEAYVLVAEDGEESGIIGFLVARKIDPEWELENVAVAEAMRRKGVGSRLLHDFISHAQNAGGTAIFLEVRQSNQDARALYGKHGFEENGVRKNYYSNPAEDAILYRLSWKITRISQ
jgi:ribosomal-protein-alanine N-acetyltransferase